MKTIYIYSDSLNSEYAFTKAEDLELCADFLSKNDLAGMNQEESSIEVFENFQEFKDYHNSKIKKQALKKLTDHEKEVLGV